MTYKDVAFEKCSHARHMIKKAILKRNAIIQEMAEAEALEPKGDNVVPIRAKA